MKKKKFAIIALAALLVPSVAARQPQRGYRGFVDAEWSRYSRRLTDYGGWHENHWGVSTVHGYQVMPELFGFFSGGDLRHTIGRNISGHGQYRTDQHHAAP